MFWKKFWESYGRVTGDSPVRGSTNHHTCPTPRHGPVPGGGGQDFASGIEEGRDIGEEWGAAEEVVAPDHGVGWG